MIAHWLRPPLSLVASACGDACFTWNKGPDGSGRPMLERGVWPSGWRTSLPALAVTAEALTPLDDTRLLAEGVRGMEEARINSRALRDTMDTLPWLKFGSASCVICRSIEWSPARIARLFAFAAVISGLRGRDESIHRCSRSQTFHDDAGGTGVSRETG